MSGDRNTGAAAEAKLSDGASLLVPMLLQAIVVNKEDAFDVVDLTPRYDSLNETSPCIGRKLQSEFHTRKRRGDRLADGIHLHWSLPATFSHIRQDANGFSDFRPVPNRWLVLRFWQPTPGGKLSHKGWIIESDWLGPDGTSPWLSKTKTGERDGFSVADKLGAARRLEEPGKPPPRIQTPLQAVAPGNLAFSDFYPSCKNVFGLHDQAADLTDKAVYSYLVVGWFADPRSDPLSGCANPEDWRKRMRELDWSVPAGTPALPTRILCHGAIHGVTWPRSREDAAREEPSKGEVAVGNSVLDAIAALVDQKTADTEKDNRRRVLQQLQFALLQHRPPSATELFSPKFAPERARLTPLRARLHEKMFTALPGGSRWEIRHLPHLPVDPQQAQQAPPAIPELPAELAELLREINNHQRLHDQTQRDLVSMQRDLYAQLHKREQLKDEMTDEEKERPITERIGELTKKIGDAKTARDTSKNDIDRVKKDIGVWFADRAGWCDHELIERPMPRYWRANDPTLLISGVPIPAIQGGATPLACRTSGQAISRFVSDVKSTFGPVDINAANLEHEIRPFVAQCPVELRGDFPGLLCEMLFLDPDRAGLLARIAYSVQKRGGGSPEDISELAKKISPFLSDRHPENFRIASASQGPAKDAWTSACSANHRWLSPWTPVFMVWDVEYAHAATSNVLQPWRFDDNDVDYRPASARNSPAPDHRAAGYARRHQGYAPLSDTVGRGLSGQDQMTWPDRYREDEFLFKPVDGKSLVAQSLGGFTEALIQQDATIQLPPLLKDSLTIDSDMLALLDRQYAIGPLPDAAGYGFFPIRGGHMDIKRLWLVDTFGRLARLIDDDRPAADRHLMVSRALASPGQSNRIRLSPRLAQPSRILFRWLSNVDHRPKDNEPKDHIQEFVGDRATQPIFGWVVPNRLDHSLMILDDAGRALGAVQLISQEGGFDGKGLRWSTLPLAAGGRRPTAGVIPNKHLLGFVIGLLNAFSEPDGRCKTRAFENLVELIGEKTEDSPPSPEYRGLSVIVGQPLALVRALLRLELLGMPAVCHTPSEHVPNPAGFVDVPFDVRLGDRRKGPDGLIGHFRDDKYDRLYLAQDLEPGPDGGADRYFPKPEERPVRLTCNPPATLLTLLLDPRHGVHVTSGILPTKVIDLPPALVSTAMAKLEAPFLVAPVLGERQLGAPNLPLPTDMPGNWTWTRAKATHAR